MTPQEKCVSLETARKLKHAGFPQDTERVWFNWYNERPYPQPDGFGHNYTLEEAWDQTKWELTTADDYQITDMMTRCWKGMYKQTLTELAAPDAQEIGALLPACITKDGINRYLNCDKDCYDNKEKPDVWHWIYSAVDSETQSWFGKDEHVNEAESRAACWFYLKEQKLI